MEYLAYAWHIVNAQCISLVSQAILLETPLLVTREESRISREMLKHDFELLWPRDPE